MPDRRVLIWLPGLAVACGAAVATAHGLYEVALAARVPAGIAWLYPLITDGLALVAYAATARLSGSAARYAWAVVVAAAGLSGLAQAAWLAADGLIAAPVLRFGIGAWPAIAAAVVAHLLYLLIDTTPRNDNAVDTPSAPVSTQPSNELSEPVLDAPSTPAAHRTPRHRTPTPPGAVRARAADAAQTYHAEHGALPTVRALMALAGVSRGTAASALAVLRQQPTPLHLVTPSKNPSPKERSQP